MKSQIKRKLSVALLACVVGLFLFVPIALADNTGSGSTDVTVMWAEDAGPSSDDGSSSTVPDEPEPSSEVVPSPIEPIDDDSSSDVVPDNEEEASSSGESSKESSKATPSGGTPAKQVTNTNSSSTGKVMPKTADATGEVVSILFIAAAMGLLGMIAGRERKEEEGK